MQLRILAVGDVVGQSGVDCLSRHLRSLKKIHGVDFTVANGENTAGVGILPGQAEELFTAGVDVITLGNHVWSKQQIVNMLEESSYLLRPANYAPAAPGQGWGVYDGPRGLKIGVLNLIGRTSMDPNCDNPFSVASRILEKAEADVVVVDFHAEATSEKGAMAWHLDGRAQALWGTHTHVPTADCHIMEKGLGFVTDLGMTGPIHSVLGMDARQALGRFLGAIPRRFHEAEGPCKLESVLFTIDTASKRCIHVERVDIRD